MQLRYNFRLYPTPCQRMELSRAFGCVRVVFNDGLRARQEAYAGGLGYISNGTLLNQVTTQAKKTPERSWLSEVSSVVLQQAVGDLNTAYRNFFDSVIGKRKGPKVAPPRFKSRKDSKQSIRFTRNAKFSITSGMKLRLPKIGDVEVRWSRKLPAEPSSVTVILDSAGRYFASFVVEVSNEPSPENADEVGIDLGLTTFAVLSNGTVIDNPRILRRSERKLAKLQKGLSKKQKDSKNRAKARSKVAKQHAKVKDARRDFHHKLSTQIIRENQAVYVEDLSVRGLARTRLAKSIHDAGWSSFVNMLEYKAKRHGRTFHKIGRFEPTSQICSSCGIKDGPKPLGIRIWTCTSCITTHDRDLNAALNILAAGRVDRLNACGGEGSGRQFTDGETSPSEARTHRGVA